MVDKILVVTMNTMRI